MKNKCKNCKYLITRDICCFCEVTGEEIKHPRLHKCHQTFDENGNVPFFGTPVNMTLSNNSEEQNITISGEQNITVSGGHNITMSEPEPQDMNWGERRLTRISDVWSYLYIHGYSNTACGDLVTEGEISELFRKILYLIVKNGGRLKIEDKQFTIDNTITLSKTDIKLLELLINDVKNNKMFPDDAFRRKE